MTQVSLFLHCLFPSRTNLKLHNISVTPKMVKKVITNLDFPKASTPELINNCLKESCFPDCWKVSLVVPRFKNVGERSTAKNYCHVSLPSVVNKVFEELAYKQ